MGKTTTRYIFILLLGVTSLASFAQGTGNDGAITVNATTYTDGIETNLNSTTASGSTSITVSSAAGFAVNQQILVIQMIGTGVGAYEENLVTAIAGNTLTLQNATSNTYTVNGGSVVEVMKIMQYTNVTVNNGGTLTAHAWNGSTGGVMYFYASGTITVNGGGKITMDGLGYRGGNGGIGGAGSAGIAVVGTGATTAGGNGTNGNTGGLGGTGSAGSGGGGTGGNGGSENSTIGTTGTAGSTGEGPSPGSNASSYSTTLEMGGGGTGATGGTGGYGGGAGGGGGADIANCGCGISATNGSVGSVGSTGSTGNTGGNGGGIMVIYCNTITGAGTVSAKGSIGGTGGQGGTGGAGGNGGYGGYSGCASGGGGGGGGNGGDGAPGGKGGNGGAGGTVWINYVTDGLTAAPSSAAGIGGSGGAQGNGGAAGFGGVCFNACAGGFGPGTTGNIGNSGSGTNGGTGASGSSGGSGSGSVSNGNPLPVHLLTFNATYETSGNSVEVKWSTASEQNNRYFTIERTVDGINWETVEELAGAGNSDNTINYESFDKQPLKGISYYRLKQTDFDGRSSYSAASVINIEVAETEQINIVPNPARCFSSVIINAHIADNASVSIYDYSGNLVKQFVYNLVKGSNTIMVDVSQFRNGVYFVLCNTVDSHYSAKFIISH